MTNIQETRLVYEPKTVGDPYTDDVSHCTVIDGEPDENGYSAIYFAGPNQRPYMYSTIFDVQYHIDGRVVYVIEPGNEEGAWERHIYNAEEWDKVHGGQTEYRPIVMW